MIEEGAKEVFPQLLKNFLSLFAFRYVRIPGEGGYTWELVESHSRGGNWIDKARIPFIDSWGH